jgi:hypothetical protein
MSRPGSNISHLLYRPHFKKAPCSAASTQFVSPRHRSSVSRDRGDLITTTCSTQLVTHIDTQWCLSIQYNQYNEAYNIKHSLLKSTSTQHMGALYAAAKVASSKSRPSIVKLLAQHIATAQLSRAESASSLPSQQLHCMAPHAVGLFTVFRSGKF